MLINFSCAASEAASWLLFKNEGNDLSITAWRIWIEKMTIVQKLKTESLRLRKERNPVAASIIFVISEIAEDEAVRVVQKLVATLRDNLNYKLTDDDEAATLLQIQILESVLPKMLTVADTSKAVVDTVKEVGPNKGAVMKALRAKHGALIDMKLAGSLLTETYGV